MKKATTAILTGIFALGIAFGASGCDKTPGIAGGYYHRGVTYQHVDEFISYYNEDFALKNEERMYFLNPTGRVMGDSDRYNSYSIDGDELIDCKFINPILSEEYYIYIEEFGDFDGEQKILGKYSYSFKVGAKFYPVSSMAEIEKLQFKFDKASLTFTIKNGDELVGECTFKTEIEITEEWYQNYIKTNLTFWR